MIRRLVTDHRSAVIITPNNPSELPRVEIVATIGFNNQILANFNARGSGIEPPNGERNRRISNHPAMISAILKRILPKENQNVPPHVVGINIQARSGVYR